MQPDDSFAPQRSDRCRRIGINAHLLSGEAGYRRAGIHQYIFQVLRHLPWEEGGPEHFIFTRQAEQLLARNGLRILRSRWPTERRLARIAWEQLAWPLLVARHHLDLLHSMAFVTPVVLPCPAVVTVYDVSFVLYPDRFPARQRLYLQSQTRRSCRQARRVIVISQSSRRDVHRLFGVPLGRIDVVRPGVDARFRPLPAAEVKVFRREKALPDRFVLHVGTLQPRKNIPVLLEAFARLNVPDLHLVMAGGKGWMTHQIFERASALNLEGRVHFTGYVADQELPFWYNAAAMLVFPSVYEGFGMPVVEAMACGTPVIASNASSVPEAAGEAALLFDPQDVAGLADRMAAVLHDPGLATTMGEDGLEQAAQFSWEQAGAETAAVYRQALQTE
ncbi:MAG: glycosyltransferase family 4 protein [Anaerolineae bacterium]